MKFYFLLIIQEQFQCDWHSIKQELESISYFIIIITSKKIKKEHTTDNSQTFYHLGNIYEF